MKPSTTPDTRDSLREYSRAVNLVKLIPFLALVSCSTLSHQVFISPPFPASISEPETVLVSALQLPFYNCQISEVRFRCVTAPRYVAAAFPLVGRFRFFASTNSGCDWPPPMDSGDAPPLTPALAAYRVDIDGEAYRLEPLPSVFGVEFPFTEHRRFVWLPE